MAHIHSFAPIADESARILILGTMPSKVSLREQQYYAHSRNLFWKIVGGILGIDPGAPYEDRVAGLVASRVALWDVLKSCTRESSLDSDIDPTTIVPNDFRSFLARHAEVRRIFFNGAKAESLFRRRVLPTLRPDSGIALVPLPSTSPANASIPLAKKVRAWGAIAVDDGVARSI